MPIEAKNDDGGIGVVSSGRSSTADQNAWDSGAPARGDCRAHAAVAWLTNG